MVNSAQPRTVEPRTAARVTPPARANPTPPRGLRNRHVQTIVGSLAVRGLGARRRREAALRADSSERILNLDDGVRLMGHHCEGSEPDRGLVVLLHGWEGGADSAYIVRLAAQARAAGYATFRLNLRDHGGTHALNEALFHSCRIGEVVDAIAAIQRGFKPRRLALVGYSLGGNFALRVGARSASASIALDKIVAICPVLHPPHTMDALENGLPVYRWHYLSKWRRSLLAKQASFPGRYRFGDLRRFKTLTATTNFFVHEFTEFASLESYLNGYSILGPALSGLKTPSRIIATVDDPIIPSADLSRLAAEASIDLTVLPWGGHCGFVIDYGLNTCVDMMVIDELDGATQTADDPLMGRGEYRVP